MAKRVTEEEKARMRELRAEGLTYAEIGREVGRSKTTVACVCDPEQAKADKARRQRPEYKAYQSVYMKDYCHTQQCREYQKAYRQTLEYKALNKAHKKSPKGKAAAKAYRESLKGKSIQAAYCQTIKGRLGNQLRSRLRQAINHNYKSGSAVRDLGCTIKQLMAHLEAQFVQGMTWDNWAYDGWHIDHIKPLASFDLADREQFLQACRYTNLQPLWAEENLSKNAKAPAEWRERQLATA